MQVHRPVFRGGLVSLQGIKEPGVLRPKEETECSEASTYIFQVLVDVEEPSCLGILVAFLFDGFLADQVLRYFRPKPFLGVILLDITSWVSCIDKGELSVL